MRESWGVRGGGIFCGCRERLRVVKGRRPICHVYDWTSGIRITITGFIVVVSRSYG